MIEFRCRACHRLLQVANDLVGRDARCPACSAVNRVPPVTEVSNPAAGDASDDSPHSPPGPVDQNFAATLPYQQSASVGGFGTRWQPAASTATPTRAIKPTLINVSEILSQTWSIFVANIGSVVGGSLIVYLLDAVCGALINTLYNGAGNSSNDLANAMIWLITFVASTAFSVWLMAGLMLYLLRIARGEPTHFGQLFEAGSLIVPASITGLIYFGICSVGLIACVVPFFVLGLTYWMALSLVVDARMSVADAFRTSQRVTTNNRWALAGIVAVSIGLSLVGVVTCGLGLVVTLPFVTLLQAVTYLAMTGQPFVVPKATSRV